MASKAPPLDWPLGPVAHRGLHAAGRGIVENTASAVTAALAKGYAIEVDLQAAAGDLPVVFHDETLDRLMAAEGPVAARTPAELARLAYRGTTDRIITLEELLELVAGRAPLFIEVKTHFTGPGEYERLIARRLAAYRGPLALMSFDPASIAAFRELSPGRPRGLISYRWDDDWLPQIPAAEREAMRHLRHVPQVAPTFIAYDIDDLPEPAPLAQRAAGLALLTWTVSTPEQRRRAARYADAIIFEGFEP